MGSTMVSGTRMPVGDAFLTAFLGYATVFAGILLLILVVIIVGKIMTAKKSDAADAPKPLAAEVKPKQQAVPAPGSAGDLKLYDTDPRTAAMIMAIVADSLGKPINELRFKSIREVKEDEV